MCRRRVTTEKPAIRLPAGATRGPGHQILGGAPPRKRESKNARCVLSLITIFDINRVHAKLLYPLLILVDSVGLVAAGQQQHRARHGSRPGASRVPGATVRSATPTRTLRAPPVERGRAVCVSRASPRELPDRVEVRRDAAVRRNADRAGAAGRGRRRHAADRRRPRPASMWQDVTPMVQHGQPTLGHVARAQAHRATADQRPRLSGAARRPCRASTPRDASRRMASARARTR